MISLMFRPKSDLTLHRSTNIDLNFTYCFLGPEHYSLWVSIYLKPQAHLINITRGASALSQLINCTYVITFEELKVETNAAKILRKIINLYTENVLGNTKQALDTTKARRIIFVFKNLQDSNYKYKIKLNTLIFHSFKQAYDSISRGKM